jgi:hypothetical protein
MKFTQVWRIAVSGALWFAALKATPHVDTDVEDE